MFDRHIFIVAPNFHGATLLGKLLNDHPLVVALGDTYPSNRFDQICGCREYVSQCPFWQKVATDIGDYRTRDGAHWLPDYPGIVGDATDRILYNTLPPSLLKRVIPDTEKERFADSFRRFTDSVHSHEPNQAATVFVDGVKSVSRVMALAASGVRVDGVIHMYRDPGDYLESTRKNLQISGARTVKTLLQYRLFHNRARRLAGFFPYMSMSYEGLAQDHEAALERVFAFLGVHSLPVQQLVRQADGQPWHFMGNASLLEFDGNIRISRYELSGAKRLLAALCAGRYRNHFK